MTIIPDSLTIVFTLPYLPVFQFTLPAITFFITFIILSQWIFSFQSYPSVILFLLLSGYYFNLISSASRAGFSSYLPPPSLTLSFLFRSPFSSAAFQTTQLFLPTCFYLSSATNYLVFSLHGCYFFLSLYRVGLCYSRDCFYFIYLVVGI